MELVSDILSDISGLAEHNDSAAELFKILKEPHFQVNQTPAVMKLALTLALTLAIITNS